MRTKLAFIAELMHGSRRFYAGAAAAVLLGTVFSYLGPLVLRFVIDTVIGGKAFAAPAMLGFLKPSAASLTWMRANLWFGGVIMLACVGFQGGFDYLRIRFASTASEAVAYRLRNRLFDHVNHLPFQVLSDLETGDLIQRCTSDVETLRQFLESQLVEVARVLMMVGVSLPLMLMLDRPMTGVAVALLPLVVGGSVYYFTRVRRFYQSMAESEARMSTVLQENLTGIRLVQAYCREAFEMGKFDTANRDYRERMLEMMRVVSVYWGFSAFLCMAQIGLVLVVGAARAGSGQLSIGTFTVFLAYVTMLVWPIRMLGHVLSDAGQSNVSLNRVWEVLARPCEPRPVAAAKPPIRGGVVFEQVEFAYEPGHPALSAVSFSVEAGQTLAILGRTGSGKSTLAHLLPRLLDCTSGTIRVDGVDLKTIDRDWLRGHIGIALQEPFLFSKSIRENILLGSCSGGTVDGRAAAAIDERLLEAAHVADIHHTVQQSFDDGYDTLVGERGVTLSGGQRQRVAIARAVIDEPPILILDDSLSAVDSETDRRIQGALRSRAGYATTFIISHRLSTLSRADWILVMENGRISAQGTHEALIAEPGLYQRIYSIQNQLEKDLRELAETDS